MCNTPVIPKYKPGDKVIFLNHCEYTIGESIWTNLEENEIWYELLGYEYRVAECCIIKRVN